MATAKLLCQNTSHKPKLNITAPTYLLTLKSEEIKKYTKAAVRNKSIKLPGCSFQKNSRKKEMPDPSHKTGVMTPQFRIIARRKTDTRTPSLKPNTPGKKRPSSKSNAAKTKTKAD